MNTYIIHDHSRKEYLVANSIQKEYGGMLSSFASEDIYEIAFNKQQKVCIVLDENQINQPNIQSFINDFTQSPKASTKLVFLSDQKFNHPNISTLPSVSYKCFNEYYKPRKVSDSKFILCHLDSKNHKNNVIIQDIVYPQNKEIPIRLVGHPGIQHIQNVGVVTDDHMLDLIYSCTGYVNISNQYVYDAVLYGKPILSSTSNDYVSSKDSFTLNDLKELFDSETKDYNHNLRQHRISNMVKSIIKL